MFDGMMMPKFARMNVAIFSYLQEISFEACQVDPI